jgi:nucleotide-binding universal stress UspA family protein
VGYDGSENSKRALERAVALAITTEGAALRIVEVANVSLPVCETTSPHYPAHDEDEIVKPGKKWPTEAVNRANEASARVSGTVVDGSPAETILNFAEKEPHRCRQKRDIRN